MVKISSDVILRPGRQADTPAVFEIFRLAITKVYFQLRIIDRLEWPSDAQLDEDWQRFGSLFEYLQTDANQFWVAEQRGRILGYARSTVHGDLQELTEFFVHPEAQSRGVGNELLDKAFPRLANAPLRLIIATIDPRAQALYLRRGVYARHPIYTFFRESQSVDINSDLTFQRLSIADGDLENLAAIDLAVLGHRRDHDHAWLMSGRFGFLALRNSLPVGYGYAGEVFSGPFAAIDPGDQPAILAYAENIAVEAGWPEFAVDVPMTNEQVVSYLINRRYRLGDFIAYHMSNRPFGSFESYLYTSPILIL